MRKRLVVGLFGALVLVSSGFALSIVAATPEETLHRSFTCSGPRKAEAKDFKVLAIRKWSKGIVALYRGNCPSSDGSLAPVLSYRVVKRSGIDWQPISSGSYEAKPSILKSKQQEGKEKLVEYNLGRSYENSRDRYTLLYGEFLSSKAKAIEVTFDNGKIIRDEGEDGVFALLASGATGICDVRVFGNDNQILQRDELISPVRKDRKANPMNTCRPISGQL